MNNSYKPTQIQQTKNQHKVYQPNHIPADWDFAKSHAKSVKPGIPIKTLDTQEACPCCLNSINKSPISFMEDNKQLNFLGEGFPLFYNFLKFCMIMLGAIIIDNSAPNIILNMQEYDCVRHQILPNQDNHPIQRRLSQVDQNHPPCDATVFNQFANISAVPTTNLRILLNITSFIGQMFILLYFRSQQSTLAQYLDQRTTTPSDFALMIENIPTGLTKYSKIIQNLISDLLPQGKIMDILIIQNLKQHFELQKQLLEILQEKKKAIINNYEAEKIQEIFMRYDKKQAEIQQLAQKMEIKQKQYFLGTAFVVMRKQIQRDMLLQKLDSLPKETIQEYFPNYDPVNQGKLSAQAAAQPNQIDWQNIHIKSSTRIKLIILYWIIFIFIIGIIFVIFFFILDSKSKQVIEAEKLGQNSPDYYAKMQSSRNLGYILVVLINFLNKFGLSWICHHLTHYQRHIQFSDLQYSFALKYMLGMFFTTALMTVIIQAAIYSNYTGTLGVIQQQTFMFLFNALFAPFVWLINPFNIIGSIKRYLYKGSPNFTQKQANQLMELYPYDMGKRYAQNMKTMWFTFLYLELIPLGVVFSFVGIFLYYIVDKYVLLRRCSVKQGISSDLSNSMITILEFTLVLKPLGQIIFAVHLKRQISVSSIIMLCIGVLFMCLPWKKILKTMFPQNFHPEQKTYQQAREQFNYNYSTCYPIRKYKSQKKLISKGKLSFKSQNTLSRHPSLKVLKSGSNIEIDSFPSKSRMVQNK